MTKYSKEGHKFERSGDGLVVLLVDGFTYRGESLAECYQLANEDQDRREEMLEKREEKRDRMKYANKPKGCRHGKKH